jgi:hypothetical protein
LQSLQRSKISIGIITIQQGNIGAQLNIDSTCDAIVFFILKAEIPKALLLITQEGGK